MNTRYLLPLVLLGLLSLVGILYTPAAQTVVGDAIDTGDTAWMLTATALVLLMTPGLAFFYGGMVRPKNVISTILQSFIALGVISLLWLAVGFGLAFGDSIGGEGTGLVGNPLSFFMFDGVGFETHPDLAPTIPLALFALFQLKFAIITPALISGAFAERIRFSAYLVFIVLFSLLIYAPLAHWTWHPNGLLRNWGVLDFAGGTVVHMSAGFAALAGAMLIGRRKAASYGSGQPANIPFVVLGAALLWFGWFGFNAGSALGANGGATQAFLTTNMAAAAAMLAWVLLDGLLGGRPSAIGAAIGAVVGLVAITPGAGFVSVGSSVFIGAFAAIVSNLAVRWKNRSSVDDTLDVFPCHGVGGMVGMVLTGVFAMDGGLITGQTQTFLYHLLALVVVGVFTFGGSYLLYKLTNAIVPLRVDEAQESMGLDLSQHDEQFGEHAPDSILDNVKA
jgi:Amt family ammonium transporter